MSNLFGPAPAGPDRTWFDQAVQMQPQSCFVMVNGCQVHYLAWNPDAIDKPAMLLAHGYRAHARWWSFIAPWLTEHYRVVALDFSGMGDSGRRELYDGQVFVDDMLGVMADAHLQAVTLIGHSFGGGRVLAACLQVPAQIKRAILLDSYLLTHDESHPPVSPPRAVAQPCPDFSAALARFRLTPEQPPGPPWLMDYVARHSLRRVAGGWDWKFDRRLPHAVSAPNERIDLTQVHVPVDYVLGEGSAVVSPEHAASIVAALPKGRGPVVIPQAWHHIMMSQPLALIAVLRALLLDL